MIEKQKERKKRKRREILPIDPDPPSRSLLVNVGGLSYRSPTNDEPTIISCLIHLDSTILGVWTYESTLVSSVFPFSYVLSRLPNEPVLEVLCVILKEKLGRSLGTQTRADNDVRQVLGVDQLCRWQEEGWGKKRKNASPRSARSGVGWSSIDCNKEQARMLANGYA